MHDPNARVSVALLYQTSELRGHLHEALAALGTPIVYEAATAELDRAALESSGARVVVVNLDPELEAHLDDVYGLLEDERYSVVFNDAQVSSALSGWDQARWTRHLAAKILGASDIDPPRPEDAESIPVPVRVEAPPGAHDDEAANDDIDEEALALEGRREDVETSPAAVAAHDAGDAPAIEPRDPLELLDTRFDEMNRPAEAAFETQAPEADDAFDFSTLEALTAAPPPPPIEDIDVSPPIDDIDMSTPAIGDIEAPKPVLHDPSEVPQTSEDDARESTVAADAETEASPSFDIEGFDLDALDRLLDQAPGGDAPLEAARDAAAVPVEPAARDDAGDAFDFLDFDAESVDIDEAIAADPSIDAAASPHVESLDVGDDDATSTTYSALSLDEDDEREERDGTGDDATAHEDANGADAGRESAPAPIRTSLAAAADWSLEDMLDGDGPPPPPTTGRADFGIEKISASEYLAPETEDTAPPPAPIESPDFSFELVPLEEAVAPKPVEETVSEAWLDPDKLRAASTIRRVFVLGASIGGPEAVREFLAELPRNYPALFVLAQHMGAEFVDLMAQQLARATELTVRTPSHGERVGHGEVVIVPTTHRLRIDPEGIVVLERAAADAAYSPSIDQVLRDVADRYGDKAGAIIFSGMTNDAIEGATYLASKGGTVYAQNPDTCVVSSMIDGVVEAGIVRFLGSPKELAEQLLADAKKS